MTAAQGDATSTDTDSSDELEDEEAQQLLADADALGDAGKKALDRMKARGNAYRDELKPYKDLGLSPSDLKALIEKSETDRSVAEQARQRQEADSAALAKANERILRSEIRAAAAGKLANPSLALKLLDLSDFDVNDDGEVDTDAINAALDALIKDEPYLAATQGDSKPRFQGGADNGTRGEGPGKSQLTQAEVERLYKERRFGEIEQARKDGRLDKLLGTKNK